MLAKRMEKEHGRAIDELIWGAPKESQCLFSSFDSRISQVYLKSKLED